MRQILLCLLLVSISSTVIAQVTDSTQVDKKSNEDQYILYEPIQTYEEFPGGDDAFQKYIKQNLKYPKKAKKLKQKAKVYVRFIIEEDGSVTNVEVLKGIDKAFDKAAVNLFKQSPKWKPATRNHKVVKTRMVVPISFDPKNQKK